MPHPSNRYSTCITIFVEEWHRVLRRWELLAHSLLQPTCEKSWVIFCWLYISLLITTGFYCQWRSQNRISHNILILQFMESRGNIGIGQRRHYRRKEHMYLGRRSDRDRRTDIKDFVKQNVENFGKIASPSVAPEFSQWAVLCCRTEKYALTCLLSPMYPRNCAMIKCKGNRLYKFLPICYLCSPTNTTATPSYYQQCIPRM